MGKQNDIRRLYRSNDDKKLAGVCGGIGEYFAVDPTAIRLVWIVLTVCTGIVPGLIVYLLAMAIMPAAPATDRATAEAQVGHSRTS